MMSVPLMLTTSHRRGTMAPLALVTPLALARLVDEAPLALGCRISADDDDDDEDEDDDEEDDAAVPDAPVDAPAPALLDFAYAAGTGGM